MESFYTALNQDEVDFENKLGLRDDDLSTPIYDFSSGDDIRFIFE